MRLIILNIANYIQYNYITILPITYNTITLQYCQLHTIQLHYNIANYIQYNYITIAIPITPGMIEA